MLHNSSGEFAWSIAAAVSFRLNSGGKYLRLKHGYNLWVSGVSSVADWWFDTLDTYSFMYLISHQNTWRESLMTTLITRVQRNCILTYIPWSLDGLLGLRCRYNIFIKLGFLVVGVFLFSRWLHLWLHGLRGFLLIVGTFCAALRGEMTFCWTHSLGYQNDVIPTGAKWRFSTSTYSATWRFRAFHLEYQTK